MPALNGLGRPSAWLYGAPQGTETMVSTETTTSPVPRVPLVAQITFPVWMCFWVPVILWGYLPGHFMVRGLLKLWRH